MNKKGFTIAETLVTFILVAFIGMTLLQLLLNYKDLASIKMKQQTYASIKDEITSRIQKQVKTRGLLYIKQASPNSIYFVYNDKPSEPVALTVHSINYIDDNVASQYGHANATGMTNTEKYDAINKKYIEYDGVKYPVPSGLPDYTDDITDYFKYQGVNINMGNIYYESSPYNLGSNGYKTIYHVIVSLGVTDLDEDYGLDMVFVANTKGSNAEFRNLVYNSSFEGSFYTEPATDENGFEIGYTDISETTCKEGAKTVAKLDPDDIDAFDLEHRLSCRCEQGQLCYMTLTQKVAIEPNEFYTLSYYYKTNYGVDATYDTLGLKNICCNGTTCKDCNDSYTTTTKPTIIGSNGNGQVWYRYVYTFKTPSGDPGYNQIKLKFAIKSKSNHESRIAIDAIQLEKGSTASTYQRT